MLDLEPIRALEKAATKGPWEACDNGKCSCKQVWAMAADYPVATIEHGEWGDGCLAADSHRTDCIGFLAYGEIPEDTAAANAAFIAAARTAVPALIEEVEQLREALAWYADQSNYDIATWGWETPADVDSGHRARALLTPEAKPDA